MSTYEVILADPPWRYRDKRPGRGGAERHYATMPPTEIAALGVRSIAAADCALFLWATGPMLAPALEIIRAWDFSFKTIAFTWVKRGESGKLAWGNGAWTRANAEYCLLGTRGRPTRVSAAVHSVIEAPRGAHSEKPDIVRRRIEQLLGDVQRIELFARHATPGWDRWGLEAPEGERRMENMTQGGAPDAHAAHNRGAASSILAPATNAMEMGS